MEEKKLSEKESLALITEMIHKAKNQYYESGFMALLWGFTNVICFTLAYMNAVVPGFNMPFNPFYLMGITFVLQFYFDRKERRLYKVLTYSDEVYRYVWTAFGISVLTLTIAGGIAGTGYWVLPVLLLLFAIPTFISGCIKKFTPLIAGGTGCWILSVVSFFNQGNFSFLLVAFGAVIAWVIPGFILKKRFYQNLAKQHDGL
jgi:hypothetical protein